VPLYLSISRARKIQSVSVGEYEKRFLTSRDLAELLHLQKQTISRWRREGKGPLYVRVRGHCLYEAGEVERFLEVRQRAGEQ
jgi:hypothetical protein